MIIGQIDFSEKEAGLNYLHKYWPLITPEGVRRREQMRRNGVTFLRAIR